MATETLSIQSEPIRIALFGAGNRARKYAAHIAARHEAARIMAVADPNTLRAIQLADTLGLPADAVFASPDDLLRAHKADAAIIATPEHAHYSNAMLALKHGCHILLEKPVSANISECQAIADEADRRGLIAAVCHVLRYHPYFSEMKRLVRSGELGEPVTINHHVRVGIDRATHTFVRGPWGVAEDTAPIMLSKCCHDIDFLLQLTGPAINAVSLGSRNLFTAANAPDGSAARCIDCGFEPTCLFSAVDLYQRRRQWIANFDIRPGQSLDDAIKEQLLNGPFGRCVFHCPNTVADRQVLSFENSSGTIATLTLQMLTATDNRTTHITLTGGELYGDEHRIHVRPFRQPERVIDFAHLSNEPGHAGADSALVDAFLEAVTNPKAGAALPTVADAIAGHHLCLTPITSPNKHKKS